MRGRIDPLVRTNRGMGFRDSIFGRGVTFACRKREYDTIFAAEAQGGDEKWYNTRHEKRNTDSACLLINRFDGAESSAWRQEKLPPATP